MAVESADDRSYFYAVDDFGVAATYTPAGGSASSVSGIFDNDFVEVETGGSVSFAQQQATFMCRTADVSAAAEGDSLVIGGENYIIRIVQPDGTGMTNLILELQ